MNTQKANVDYEHLRTRLDTLAAETSTKESIAADEALHETLVVLFARILKILDNLNSVLPIVNALRGEGMKLRHWDKVRGIQSLCAS